MNEGKNEWKGGYRGARRREGGLQSNLRRGAGVAEQNRLGRGHRQQLTGRQSEINTGWGDGKGLKAGEGVELPTPPPQRGL